MCGWVSEAPIYGQSCVVKIFLRLGPIDKQIDRAIDALHSPKRLFPIFWRILSFTQFLMANFLAFPGLFFLIFIFLNTVDVNKGSKKIADDWIWTAEICCWTRPNLITGLP